LSVIKTSQRVLNGISNLFRDQFYRSAAVDVNSDLRVLLLDLFAVVVELHVVFLDLFALIGLLLN